MIARWPGRIAPGTVSEHVGYFPDVLPTLADLAGARPTCRRTSTASRSRRRLLGRPEEQETHPYLYWEAAGPKQNTVQQAVRWGNWKAVRHGPGAGWELYDLEADIGEAKGRRGESSRRAGADRRHLPGGPHPRTALRARPERVGGGLREVGPADPIHSFSPREKVPRRGG